MPLQTARRRLRAAIPAANINMVSASKDAPPKALEQPPLLLLELPPPIGFGLIVKSNVELAVSGLLSITLTVNEDCCGVVGVPEIKPCAFLFKPAGGSPLAILNVADPTLAIAVHNTRSG